ncbi:MAG: hypothetical protein J5588_05980, partial [Bacteroidales bacterium]|nr:hypothetical protein [Bacteroidales bacterium]
MDLEKYEREHRKRIEKYQRQIKLIVERYIAEATKLGSSVKNFNDKKPFTFNDYPQTKSKAKKLLDQYANDINVSIVNGVSAEWTYANNKNNEIFNLFGGYKQFSNEINKFYNAQTEKAVETFVKRKTNGLNLSDRVWNIKGAFKEELEMSIDLGLRDGKSAQEMSRDIRQYLNNPDKLFRRVRDEHGNLQLSKNA